MKPLRLVVLLVVVILLGSLSMAACGGSGSSATSPSPTPSPTTATLSGTVVDALTSGVLAGAAISIFDGPNAGRSTTSDANGAFQLTGLAVGGFTINVRRDGYDNLSQGVTLTADQTLSVRLAKTRLALSGAWTGTYTQTLYGNQTTASVPTATLSQTGTAVTGTFRTSGTYQGTFDGTLTSEFTDAGISGTLRLAVPSSTGAVLCQSSGTFTGTPYPAFTITSPLQVSTNCTGTISNVTLVLTR